MTAYIRNPLTVVWAFLMGITLLSWTLSRDGGTSHQLNELVTCGVLLMAAVKSQLVIRYFMEVRHAPAWLKRVMNGWLVWLFGLLIWAYFAAV